MTRSTTPIFLGERPSTPTRGKQVIYRPAPNLGVRLQPLEGGGEEPKEKVQAKVPAELYQIDKAPAGDGLPDGFEPLDHGPDWRYQCCEVQPANVAGFREHAYLFNVVVALEWQPDRAFLGQLRWAFKQASDYLFDVTNGWMAFGQIVIGGPALMPAADIQIMASNRLHPRSWVGGMHDEKRYKPIRLGRGLWSDRQQTAFSWDEPEAFRVLIHEWGHYALDLTDEYLAKPSGQECPVVLPKIMAGKESVMANTEGISELSPDQLANLRATHYKRINPDLGRNEGPQRLQAELPRLFLTNDLHTLASPHACLSHDSQQAAEELLGAPLAPNHCWLYVAQGAGDEQPPTRIIAQGTLDARSLEGQGFPLLGAQQGDAVVLISTPPGQPANILKGKVQGSTVVNWNSATPAQLPVISVVPGSLDAEQRVPVSVQLSEAPPTEAFLFQLGVPGGEELVFAEGATASEPVSLSVLDGLVWMRWGDGIAIVPFSQGGGPPFHNPAPQNPLTAGSSDGNAMLFCYDNERTAAPSDTSAPTENDDRYSKIKVVTTLVLGVPFTATLPGEPTVLSYAFSLASNDAIPQELSPTLIMYYDVPESIPNMDALREGSVRIYRLVNRSWAEQQTVNPITRGSSYAATPLCYHSDSYADSTLVEEEAPTGRIEHYLVCWSGAAHTAR